MQIIFKNIRLRIKEVYTYIKRVYAYFLSIIIIIKKIKE